MAPPPLWKMEDACGLPMDSAFEEAEAPLLSPKAEAPRGRQKVCTVTCMSTHFYGSDVFCCSSTPCDFVRLATRKIDE